MSGDQEESGQAEAGGGRRPGDRAHRDVAAGKAPSEAALRDSEERYRTLVDSIDEGFCTIEVLFDVDDNPVDYRFLQANPAFERQTGIKNAVGRRMREIAPDHEQYWFDIYGRIALGGEPEKFENKADALGHWYEVFAFRMGRPEERRVGILFKDIRERMLAQTSLRESEERQLFLLKLSDALRPIASPLTVAETACRILVEHLNASRAQFSEVEGEPGAEIGVVRGEHIRSGQPLTRRYPLGAFGEPLVAMLRAGDTLVLTDTGQDERLNAAQRQAFSAVESPAAVAVPLVKEGRLVATFAIHHATPRDWTADEVVLIEETAERTWGAFERSRVEVALRESEEKYRSLFETMAQGYDECEMIRDAEGRALDYRILEMNPAFADLVGVQGADARGRTAREIIPGLEDWWVETLDEIVRGGEPRRIEHEVGPLGRWYEVHVFPKGGDRFVALFADISERRRADEVLRDSEERQKFLLSLADAMRAERDQKEIALAALRLLRQHLGLDRGYIANFQGEDRPVDIVAEHGRADLAPMPQQLQPTDFPQGFKKAGEGVLVVDDIWTRQDLTDLDRQSLDAIGLTAFIVAPLHRGAEGMVWALVSGSTAPRHWTPNEVVLLVEAAERIWTALSRASAETALRESEERLSQFGEASSDVLWSRDAETLDWVYLTPAFEKIYGLSRKNAIEGDDLSNWSNLILPEDRPMALAMIDRVRQGERVTFEFRIKRPSDGAERWIRNTDFPIRDADGRVISIGGVGQDITAEKDASNRLEVLVAELQHRTRNLIAVVQAVADKTRQESASLDDFRGRFRERLVAVSRAQALLSQLGKGERIPFDRLLTTELQAHGAVDGLRRQVTLEGPEGVLLRSSTVQTFALALHELTTNAVKYGALSTPQGHLSVLWRIEQHEGVPQLYVEWGESGVTMPEPGAAQGSGYGRELIERALPYQLKAKTTYETGSDGVRCTIIVPIPDLANHGYND